MRGRGRATVLLGAIAKLLVFGVDGGRRVALAVFRYLAVVLCGVAADSVDKWGDVSAKETSGRHTLHRRG